MNTKHFITMPRSYFMMKKYVNIYMGVIYIAFNQISEAITLIKALNLKHAQAQLVCDLKFVNLSLACNLYCI